MIHYPYKCFQYILTKTIHPKDEEYTFAWRGETYLMVRGLMESIDKDTNAKLFELKPGMVAYDKNKVVFDTPEDKLKYSAPGSEGAFYTNIARALEESELYCFDTVANKKGIPTVSVLKLEADQSHTFNEPTKLFLCHGGIITSERTIIGPKQIKIENSPQTVVSTTKSYFYIIHN